MRSFLSRVRSWTAMRPQRAFGVVGAIVVIGVVVAAASLFNRAEDVATPSTSPVLVPNVYGERVTNVVDRSGLDIPTGALRECVLAGVDSDPALVDALAEVGPASPEFGRLTALVERCRITTGDWDDLPIDPTDWGD